MVRVKIFTDGSDSVLEQRINEWLATADWVEIQHVQQTESASDAIGWSLTVSIFYLTVDEQS